MLQLELLVCQHLLVSLDMYFEFPDYAMNDSNYISHQELRSGICACIIGGFKIQDYVVTLRFETKSAHVMAILTVTDSGAQTYTHGVRSLN